ncbi:MAG: toprim domain-containing protein, partial [Candidatus Aenigmarchaeota archaeon]|nr:toprim domain-containing protein [Candidatus Aenigmarchaeota archaeon]
KEIQKEVLNYKEVPIIVEGKRDEEAIRKLGFQKIFKISGKPLEKVLDEVKDYKSVVILSDFDEEGKKIFAKLRRLFSSHRIKVHTFLRNKIKSIFKIKKIEEINSLIKCMEDDYYGKTCSIYDKIFNRSRIFLRRNGGKTRRNRSNIRSN